MVVQPQVAIRHAAAIHVLAVNKAQSAVYGYRFLTEFGFRRVASQIGIGAAEEKQSRRYGDTAIGADSERIKVIALPDEPCRNGKVGAENPEISAGRDACVGVTVVAEARLDVKTRNRAIKCFA